VYTWKALKENSSTDVGVHFASFIGYYYRLDEGNSTYALLALLVQRLELKE